MSGVLVHEWIAQDGGSENVLKAMAVAFPDTPIRCLWNDLTGQFDQQRVHESWFARTPLRHHKGLAMPLMPATWRSLRWSGEEWALISSRAFAHHARFRGAPPDFRRLVYVHTPAPAVWTPDLVTRGDNLAARVAFHLMRHADRRRAREGAAFAANSDFVRRRIAAAWGVEARVIYPPVEVERIQREADWRTRLTPEEAEQLADLPDGFVLGASRFLPYKRLDLVIRVGEAIGRPVVLAGDGPGLTALRAVADAVRVPVRFVHAPSVALLYALYQQTALFVYPAVEEFGVLPVEAMAAGAPVLAQALGGAAEGVEPELSGAHSTFSSPHEIRERSAVAMAGRRSDRVGRAKDFSAARFRTEITEWVAER